MEEWLATLEKNSEPITCFSAEAEIPSIPDTPYSPILYIKGAEEDQSITQVVFRQVTL